LLSPFDRLIHDRKRAIELFEFDYQNAAFTKTMSAAVHREIEELAQWLDLDLRLPRSGA
jgi:hypothetical protein